MNLVHLKYAVEVEKCASITKAAESLYMGQPNLSRAIRELEESLGIKIFKRTSKGIIPTAEGEEFLGYARKILSQVDAVEKIYKGDKTAAQSFSISVPRATYIAEAFTQFAKKLDRSKETEIFYKETNSMRAVKNILENDYGLGIIRYNSSYDKNFKEMLKEKGLDSELICEFKYEILISKDHPLASKEKIVVSDLEPYVEISHADPFVPSMPASHIQKESMSDGVSKHIFIFERGSQMELLQEVKDSFMMVSPIPNDTLKKFDFVLRECADNNKVQRDMLIFRSGHIITGLEKSFIDELMKVKRALY